LGDARKNGATGVLTFGVAGSNHALATSIYARAAGLQCHSMLTRQSNAAYVRRNLLAGLHSGAHLHACDSEESARRLAARTAESAARDGEMLTAIPGGGSSALGCLGFVNAGLELAEQVRTGTMPVPDTIYIALGTVGTAAGLMVGLRLAGLNTRIVAVRVVREDIATPARFRRLASGVREFVGGPADAGVELPEIRHEFLGAGYARFTPAGVAAMESARQLAGLKLEGTYTGKSFAAMLSDLGSGRLEDQNVLFWNTYNSRPLACEATALDYHQLPDPFHYYYESPLQELDPEA
ncbi:MAG: pyridoxal-phosphate dependent enzyme, partial [Chromatiales bacterium]|nr:pyridoxal-phosphate dependent enzyme [Chromatiales bacterium]